MSDELTVGSTPLKTGETVTVLAAWPEELAPCHIRTPSYVRGRSGEIVGLLGEFPNPEDLAFGRSAERRKLYHVSFRLADLWPGEAASADHVLVELYEHWLVGWEPRS